MDELPRRRYRLVVEGHPGPGPVVVVRHDYRHQGRAQARAYFMRTFPHLTPYGGPWLVQYEGLEPMVPTDYRAEA